MKYTQEQVIAMCLAKYGDRYDYSKMVYVNNASPITVICKLHGEFSVIAGEHFRKRGMGGCRKCGSEYTASLKRIPLEDILVKLTSIQSGYTFPFIESEYHHTRSEITLKCMSCNEIVPNLEVNNLIRYRYTCRNCGPVSRGTKRVTGSSPSNRYTTEDFIEVANKKHNNKYQYNRCRYTTSHNKVIITCPIHGDFEQLAYMHLQGRGCKACGELSRASKRLRNSAEWLAYCASIHNNYYSYASTEYKGAAHKVIVTCPKHGDFLVKAQRHEYGDGCPKCKRSKGELAVSMYLDNRGIVYEIQKRFPACRDKAPLPFDFYIPSLNMCIEFDGDQHHAPALHWHKTKEAAEEKLRYVQLHDNIKTKYCKDGGIHLYRIKRTDNIEKVLDSIFADI